jgi:hypothetical protein
MTFAQGQSSLSEAGSLQLTAQLFFPNKKPKHGRTNRENKKEYCPI